MNAPSSAAQTVGPGPAVLAYDMVHGGQVRLRVSGFDLAEMPGYVARLMAASGPLLRQLELDLSNETSLNPAGLAFVMRARTAVLATRGELRLRGLQPGVRDQLAAIGIPELTRPLSDPRAFAGPAEPAGCTLPGSTLPPPRPHAARTASTG